MPRFVIQCHSLPDGDQHWDLMLESPRGLYTWSLPSPPDDPDALPMTVKQLTNHRAEYLDFEGEISNGRGRVDIHDCGSYSWIEQDNANPPTGISPAGTHNQPDIADELNFDLVGRRLSGRFRLTRETQTGKDLWRLGRISDT